jgi:hypothetical protein
MARARVAAEYAYCEALDREDGAANLRVIRDEHATRGYGLELARSREVDREGAIYDARLRADRRGGCRHGPG